MQTESLRKALGLSLLTAFLSTLLLCFAVGARLLFPFPRLSAAALCTGLLLLIVPPLTTRGRASFGARSGVLVNLTTLGLAPCLLAGAALALSEPLVQGHFRCGNGDLGLVLVVPVLLGIGFTASIGVALGMSLVRSRILEWVLRVLAYGVVLAAAVLSVGAVLAHAKPEPDAYVASLPRIGTLWPLPKEERSSGPVPTLRAGSERPAALADGSMLAYWVPDKPCTLEVAWQTGGAPSRFTIDDTLCKPITLRADHAHKLWVVDATAGDDDDPRPAFVIREGDPSRGDLNVVDVKSSLRPPVGWTLGALLGTAVAFTFLVAGPFARRRAAQLAGGVQGEHRKPGWVHFDGEPPSHLPAAAMLPAGPVVVRRPAPPQEGSYRSTGAPLATESVTVGTLDAMRAEAQTILSNHDAFALAVAFLGALPLAYFSWLH